MKSIRFVLFIALLQIAGNIDAQTEYYAGTSQISIEPDQALLSLHLGGYGLPRNGRFTLQWTSLGSLPEAVSLAVSGNNMYIISNNELLRLVPENQSWKWEKAGPAEGIISVAGAEGKMYGLNSNGELLETSLQGTVKWKKTGAIEGSVITLAASEGFLYAANKEGAVWSADLSKKKPEWKKSESPAGILSLTANNGILYAMTNEGFIYKYELSGGDVKWLMMAYRNWETIKEDINHIAVFNDRLYGISRNNILYIGSHRSEGNLTSRAMAIKNGNKTVVIINIDVCGLDDEFTGIIKEEIFRKTGIPGSAIFINSSHTHFAPVSQNWLTWQEANQRPDSIYLNQTLRNGLISSVEKALVSLEPAEIYFGRGQTDIGYNRSLKDHPELYDSAVDVIKVVYPEKNSESYLFIAACHPVFSTAGTLHYTISANYPGVARMLIERRTGTSNSLFLQGTAGDINPRDNGENIAGEKLANEVIAVLKRPMEKITGSISFFIDTVNIPITPWSKDEIIAYKEANISKSGDVYAEKNVKWSNLMLKYYDEGTMPQSLPVYIQTFNIGNWKLVGYSRETTTEYGFGVKNLYPGKLVSVAGYTNDVSSYLPTRKHLEQKNYEGLDSFFWYGSPAVFPPDVYDIILDDIKRLSR
ncbi:MAG: hypothetical protein A2X05_02820 [Bacteroidetes bacterium GWE2_41_25]|nr:MAG: hypothetical protein A2X03_09560 [Bacteroidetes bacterium GWA2_40_15]OFX92889.1 MAG: hypothetical protein A2X06_15840 [Bacteroidetes bacterium GWC2_40_22]OFY03824.1 MAG: hypothetical protein A2X05_02820 [Bacteroidetes bacterium GWE2_41_25]OFY59380.1 MAG: hypothetical protein A2X04_15470 [Bacteroidetes bacterium GWF2_41_9]HBH84557.1 hypothetical protein [Bacteroidales bacterium]